jgi:hypothetical protein
MLPAQKLIEHADLSDHLRLYCGYDGRYAIEEHQKLFNQRKAIKKRYNEQKLFNPEIETKTAERAYRYPPRWFKWAISQNADYRKARKTRHFWKVIPG